jgi:hypothetical protein
MAVSDQLTELADELAKLATRAKEAETRAHAARAQSRADLEQEVGSARVSAQAGADRLREAADERKESISAPWTNVQKSWDEEMTQVRAHVESKEEHDVRVAQRRAKNAEAEFAVDFAYSAVVEAEYAALDAALVKKEADELSAAAGARA